MKVLLTAVNAKYIHSNLAVYDLRAYAEAYGTGGAQVEIGEYTINHTIDYILEGIYKAKPDVLCFSCYIWNLDYVEQLMDEYHKICPEVPIWVGGPEVSYETEAFLKAHPQVTGQWLAREKRLFWNCVRTTQKRVPERRRGRWISRESRESCTVPERAS